VTRFPLYIIEGGPGSGNWGHGGLKGVWGGSSPGGGGKHGVARRIDHGAVQARMKELSPEELRYIIKDAGEAEKAMPDGPNAGFYRDTVLYAAQELRRREKGETPRLRNDRSLRRKSTDSLEFILKDASSAVAAMPESTKALKYTKEVLAAATELSRRIKATFPGSSAGAMSSRMKRSVAMVADKDLPKLLSDTAEDFLRMTKSGKKPPIAYDGVIFVAQELIRRKSKK
jgi:hypothetical protein